MSATTIADRYRVERRLGVGGMSTVQLAFDERLERWVAVKLLAEHLAHDEGFSARFRREALAAARLVHPNIVQVFDFGLDESADQQFIVMEYVEGKSCAELLRDRGYLSVPEVVDIIGQACRGLDHAHRNGVVHRDVKPGNLLLSGDDVVKLADFGIAKAAEQTGITQIGSVLGTAAYLAPEQARGEEAGRGADIYALGVVTYQLLAGRLPYEAQSLTELALKQQNEPPVLLDQVNGDVPPALAHAVARALDLDLDRRYPDALAMGDALRDGAEGIEPPAPPGGWADETEATRVVAPRDPTDATRVVQRREPRQPTRPPREERRPTAREREREAPRRRRRRLAPFLVILALLAAAAIGIYIADQSSGNPNLNHSVIKHDVNQAVDALKSFIDDNTR